MVDVPLLAGLAALAGPAALPALEGLGPGPLGIPAASWLAAVLASVLCGFVGAAVVLRRLVALGGGIAHAAFGGIGLAVAAGFEPRLGAATVAVVAAAALAPLRRERPARQDAVIGVLWALGMATGMLLLAGSAHGDLDVEGYLFGDIAHVRAVDLVTLAAVSTAVLLAFVLFGRELVATAFDAEHARLQGLPVARLSFLLMILVALSLVALLALVGVVLAIALLAIPPLIALRLFRGLPGVIAGGCAIALAISLAGLALAARTGWPAGPTIVLVGGAALGAARLLRPPSRRARAAERPA